MNLRQKLKKAKRELEFYKNFMPTSNTLLIYQEHIQCENLRSVITMRRNDPRVLYYPESIQDDLIQDLIPKLKDYTTFTAIDNRKSEHFPSNSITFMADVIVGKKMEEQIIQDKIAQRGEM